MEASQPGSAKLEAFLDEVRPAIDRALDQLLPAEDTPPAVLHQAMRYSVFAGGKRLRPALCLAGYSAFRNDWNRVVSVAAALELIHTYSLIHDDLPSIDDDHFRRGVPSCHKVYGEAIAILAGDGLLALAFETVVKEDFCDSRVREITLCLARAAGTREGMIAGQVLDLTAQNGRADAEELEAIHRYKTGALIETSVKIGACLAGATDSSLASIAAYGARIGLAFQIVDDILDVIASTEALGKTSGKDREQKKATYPGLHGIEASRTMVRHITAEARSSCRELGERAGLLVEIADYLENRSS